MNSRNKFNRQDANVYMFASRFLFNQVEHESAGSRTSFLTIPVTNMVRPEQFKLQVNKKLNKTLIDLGGTTEGYSMIIAGDVEGSRSGTIGLRVLQNPECPHYHGMCTFPPEVWKVVEDDGVNI